MTGIRNDNLPSQNVLRHEADSLARPQNDSAQTGSGKVGNRVAQLLTSEALDAQGEFLPRFSTFEKAKLLQAHSAFAKQNESAQSENITPLLDRKITPAKEDKKQAIQMSFIVENFLSASGNGDGFVSACLLAKIDPDTVDDQKRKLFDQRLSELLSDKHTSDDSNTIDVSVLIKESAKVISEISRPQHPD